MAEEGAGFLADVEGADKLTEKGITDEKGLAEAYFQLQRELEHRPKPPGDDASQEDWRKFRERIGIVKPEQPGYQVPEDVPEAQRQRVMEATQLIPPGSMTDAEYRDFAQKLASGDESKRQEAITQGREAIAKQAEQSREVHGVDAMVSAEEEAAKRFGTDQALMDKMRPLLKHPLMVETLSTLAAAQKERALPTHDTNLQKPAHAMTMAQLGHELEQIQDITNHKDFKKADPKNAEVIAKADNLFKIMHEGGFKSAQEMQRHRG